MLLDLLGRFLYSGKELSCVLLMPEIVFWDRPTLTYREPPTMNSILRYLLLNNEFVISLRCILSHEPD